MTNFWKRTALQLRQPLACFSALAAGCLISGHSYADENDQKPAPQGSNLERLFSQEVIQFAPVPPMQQDGLRPLRQSVQLSHQLTPMAPIATGPSANELLGTMKQSSQQSSSAETSARMLVPATTTPTKPVQQIPFTQQVQNKNFAYPTSLASWQEPSQETSNRAAKPTNRNYGNLPLSKPPVARVASAMPSTAAPKALTGVHRLSQIDMAKFESAVMSTWGNRIKTSSSLDGRYIRVELPTRVNQRMAMMIDRETQTLNYEGDDSLRDNWHQLIANIDSTPRRRADGTLEHTIVVDQNRAEMATIRQVVYLAGLSQDITQPVQQPQDGQDQLTLPPGTVMPQEVQIPQGVQGVKNAVKILQDPDTGAITLVGSAEDIAIVKKYIEKISEESKANQAKVKRIPLKNLQSEAIAEQLQEIYDSSYQSSKGTASIEAISNPNALLVVGQPGGIKAVEDMVAEMDVEGGLETDGFRAFPLKYLSAADAKSRLLTFFNQANPGDGPQLPGAPVTVVADFRSNTVIVKGSKQFIQQAEDFLKTIDVGKGQKTNIVKIFPLKNTLAEELAIVIQDAISGQQQNAGQGYNPNQQAQQNQTQQAQVDQFRSTLGSAQLSLKMINNQGEEVDGGIMFDVRVTADRNSNSLVVTGPQESMDLVGALIENLDRIPNAETQIKVFEIVNGDAQTLLEMLDTLFSSDQTQQGGQGGQQTSNLSQLPLQGVTTTDGATLVNIRFSIDQRTNTIIASGPAGDLQVVEDLLNRLDEKDTTDRRPRVYRLSNAPALDVAETINAYLDPRNDIVENDPRSVGTFIQADRSVIVVAETGSNSLIVSATPEQRAEIEELIRGLDRRPPMVKVKVLIAEVDLNALEEFGVEIGVQDSLLFDRGTSVGADGSIDGIGFPFNSGSVPNQNATFPETLAGQALSNLGIGKINNSVGYGGLVLSAGNESISILMRALKDKQCLRVLSRPHIMTMENLQGRVQIGSSVPRVSGTTQTNFGTTQNVTFEDVGVILEVTPRVSPDGMIVMAVNAVKSNVDPDQTGVTIGFGNNGEPILAPIIRETEANTTLMARSGQTVVFSGLIQEDKTHTERGAPILSDLPIIGPMFKFESDEAVRKELMIIMTPYLITDDQDIATQNQDEMDRMHWCLCDVAEVYGNTDYHGYEGTESGIRTIYPDSDGGQPVYDVGGVPRPGFESLPSQSRAQRQTQEQGGVQQAGFSNEDQGK